MVRALLLPHLLGRPTETRIGRGLPWKLAGDSLTWGLDLGLLTQGSGIRAQSACFPGRCYGYLPEI